MFWGGQVKQFFTRGEQTALIEEMIGNQKVVQAFTKISGFFLPFQLPPPV